MQVIADHTSRRLLENAGARIQADCMRTCKRPLVLFHGIFIQRFVIIQSALI